MKKILCPTDFSPAATNAVAYAAKFCQVTDSEMTLFHVQSIFSLSPVDVIQGRATQLQSAAEMLEEQSDEVSAVFKIVSHAETQPAISPLSGIIERKASNYDLIIMGGGKTHDFYSFLAGSNAYNAMKRSRIPVILIPDGYLFAPIERVVYAYDVLEDQHLPVRQLQPWLDKLKARLTVLEILEEAISLDIEEEMADVSKLMELRYPDIPMEIDSVHAAEKSCAIDRYMKEQKGDMLVLCTRHRSLIASLFHRSTIRSICELASYPVCIVHD